ncbi:hypothetical protein [Paenibacillus oleatilyticus]|uniref:hypothetical protein n=1 Tax=Paenibacillus oleatilyticus TaxID=2594886 RepID=UPI001C1FCB91|nr:hypothetical protein [Paenibacillus oleatilyticus]MBU7316026.1 hypothetical protein [Paenibacillus oleatilyticus]
MDRRYTCWLTKEGVERITEERDEILNVTIKNIYGDDKKRKVLLGRVLRLNRMLNYNGNHKSRIIQYPSVNEVKQRHSSPIYEDRIKPEEIVIDKINIWNELIAQKKKDLDVFMSYDTPIKQVGLLTANKVIELEDEIEEHEREWRTFIEDAKFMGILKKCDCGVLSSKLKCYECQDSKDYELGEMR